MARTTGSEQSAAEQQAAERAKRLRAVERLQELCKDIAPGRSLVDELIAERRAEARAEERKFGLRPYDDDD